MAHSNRRQDGLVSPKVGVIFDISETALKVHQSPKQKSLFILVLIQVSLAQFHPPRGSVRVAIFLSCYFRTRDFIVT